MKTGGESVRKTRIVTVVWTESNHYEVEDAESDEEAIERAKDFWASGSGLGVPGVREVSLGSEFADIDRAYVDEDEFRDTEEESE